MQVTVTTKKGSSYLLEPIGFGLLQVTRTSAHSIIQLDRGPCPGDVFTATDARWVARPGRLMLQLRTPQGGVVTTSPVTATVGAVELITSDPQAA